MSRLTFQCFDAAVLLRGVDELGCCRQRLATLGLSHAECFHPDIDGASSLVALVWKDESCVAVSVHPGRLPSWQPLSSLRPRSIHWLDLGYGRQLDHLFETTQAIGQSADGGLQGGADQACS